MRHVRTHAELDFDSPDVGWAGPLGAEVLAAFNQLQATEHMLLLAVWKCEYNLAKDMNITEVLSVSAVDQSEAMKAIMAHIHRGIVDTMSIPSERIEAMYEAAIEANKLILKANATGGPVMFELRCPGVSFTFRMMKAHVAISEWEYPDDDGEVWTGSIFPYTVQCELETSRYLINKSENPVTAQEGGH